MNFDMFSSKQNDDMDPNYIYPRPYIDPMMYINPYTMNGSPFPNQQMDPNMTNSGYMTYMNPYMNNPMMGQYPNDQDYEDFDYEDMNDYYLDMDMPNQMPNNMMPNPAAMMMPPMNPYMMNGGMYPQGMPMMNGMMMPYQMPMMPWMMSPYMMMPGMPQIHMEEFDEEEM